MKFLIFNLLLLTVHAAPLWMEQLSDISRERRSLGLNDNNRTQQVEKVDFSSLAGLNRSLNHTDIRYDSLSPYVQHQVDSYEHNEAHNDFTAEAYGDPHFIIEQDDHKVCFDLYGDQNNEIELLADVRSGLRVWGTVKRREESGTIVFDEIHVVTPKGAHIVSNGRQTNVSGTNSPSARLRDFELVQSEQSIDLVVTIGRQSKIKMAISTARHLSVSFTQLKQITNRVSGIIGEFYRQQFSIIDNTFTFGGYQFPVEQVKSGRRKNCWFLTPYQIRQLFGFKY